MRIVQRLRNYWINLRYKLGLLSKEEVMKELLPERERLIKEMPAEVQKDIRPILNQLDDFRTMANPAEFWSLTKDLSSKFEYFSKKYSDNQALKEVTDKVNYVTGVDAVGYRPGGARIWKFFLNPFSVFSFFFEQHHACASALEVWNTEVIHDGCRLVADDNTVPDERLVQVEKTLNKINIWQLRLDLLRHYWVYGNALILVHKNPFGQPVRFELLVMDRCEPIYDKFQDKLIGWSVTTGHETVSYTSDQILHLKAPSLRHPDIGLPPCSSLVTDLEACLGGSSLNNTMMFKAGMVSTLIALDDPKSTSNGKNLDRELRKLQQEIQANFSGTKAGGTMMVSNYVKNVFKLSQMSEWDGAFLKFRAEVARTLATVMGVPLGKLNIPLLAQAQYEASSLKDKNDADFDKRIAAVMLIIDRFINHQILKRSLKIMDVELVANGRTSMTLQSARASKIAGDTGPLYTVNEHRVKFYGDTPLPAWDKRGRQIIDNSKNRDLNSKPPEFAKYDSIREEASIASPSEDDALDSGEAA